MQDVRMNLPVAAVATASATATTAATAAVTSATTAASMTPAVAPSAATTAAPAFTLGTRFVDDERPAKKFPPVESCNNLFRFGIVPNLGESETARLARESIAKQCERIRLHARFRKQRRYIFLSGLERQIAHVQFLHRPSPCAAVMREARPARLEEAGSRPRAVSNAPATPG